MLAYIITIVHHDFKLGFQALQGICRVIRCNAYGVARSSDCCIGLTQAPLVLALDARMYHAALLYNVDSSNKTVSAGTGQSSVAFSQAFKGFHGCICVQCLALLCIKRVGQHM